MAKPTDEQEQALRDLLSANIKKYRRRRAWSQFALAAKIDISTNFLADIEAGNTWVSSLTLIKLAKAFEIEAFELLKPEKSADTDEIQEEEARTKAIIDRIFQDLNVVLKDSIEKSLNHVKKNHC